MKGTRAGIAIAITTTLAACSSVPKPPTVSERHREPVNSSAEVQLQSCKGDLSNTRIMLQEASHLADSASAALAQMSARCTVTRPETSLPRAEPGVKPMAFSNVEPASTIFVVHFDYASTNVNLTEQGAIALSEAARTAELIVVRGRTDGMVETPGEVRVAKERAATVGRYLRALGIDASKVRETFQAVGDNIADNSTEIGRAENRRAEVEVYQVAPQRRYLDQQSIVASVTPEQ
jgi:outer membrane protein OmpA-like peptidoglycan-associated protein